MKRIILTLVCSLMVFAATMFMTYKYVEGEELRDADKLNAMLVNRVSDYTDRSLRMSETATISFLTGLLYTREHVQADGTSSTELYISDKYKTELKATVYEVLDDFLEINKHASTAMFIFAPDALPGGKHGIYAPSLKRGDYTRYDLSESYDFAASENYKRLQTAHGAIWSVPSSESPVAGRRVVCYVPIYDVSGRFFAAFAVNYDVSDLRRRLSKVLPYGADNSGIFLVDDANAIITSTYNYDARRYSSAEEMQRELQRSGVLQRPDSAEVTSPEVRYVADFGGERHYVYSEELRHIPWRVIVVCSEDAIYAAVIHTANIVTVVALIGMALMLLCCVVIFRQMRNNLRHRVALQSELRLASQMQLSILRPSEAETDDFRLATCLKPAKETGGDLYDYVVRGRELVFVVGDVSGKGVSAALFMTQVCSLFRSAVSRCDGPAAIVSEINDVLSRHNPQMTFCTMIVGVYDPIERSLRYCNAGHTRPVAVIGGLAATIDVLPNMAVGVMEQYGYREQSLQLHEGDTIVAYTDGVTEAMNREHHLYGEQRLIETIGAAQGAGQIIEATMASVARYSAGEPQSDDITIMAITLR